MIEGVLKRKEKIVITAIDVLNESGINGLTTKEIARRQGITEPAIYRQFHGKKEIVKAILDSYSFYDEVIKNTIIDNKIQGEDGIRYFVAAYAEYYQSYPEITTVMFSFDTFKYDEPTNKEMKKIINNRYTFLNSLVLNSYENTLSIEEIQALTDAIFSMIWAVTFLWRMEDCSFDVKERIILGVDNILKF